MKLRLFIFVLMTCALTGVFADIAQGLAQADKLNDDEAYVNEETFLNGLLKDAQTPKDKAEVLWRLSRTTLYLGEAADGRKDPKDKVLKIYEKGEAYADQAISLDAAQHQAYYWKASNVGKWGTTKGILDSLGKAKPMRDTLVKVVSIKDDFSDAYYVLGQLYEKVPGAPISFGNKDSAVSYGRLSVALYEKELSSGVRTKPSFDYYIQFASHLIERNWTATKRTQEQDKKAAKYKTLKEASERGAVYEGTVSIPNVSDKEEAIQILKKTISGLEALSNPTSSQKDDLQTAKDMLKKNS